LDQEQYDTLVSIVTSPINVKPKSRVLDCGCGAGAFVSTMVRLYGQLFCTGVDFSDTLVQVARYNVDGMFYQGDITDLGFLRDEEDRAVDNFAAAEADDDNEHRELARQRSLSRTLVQFDVITCFSVVFYLNSPDDVAKSVREMKSFLAPGGTIYIGDVNDLGKHALAMELRGETHKDQEKLSKDNPDHLYLPVSYWEALAKELNMGMEVMHHSDTKLAEFYDTAPYRYSVYLRDNL
jgi:SAM-dependent methyltransferase